MIAFAAYLLAGALHEFGEAGGGEVLEIAGPLGAVAFALACGWLYVRPRRRPAASPTTEFRTAEKPALITRP